MSLVANQWWILFPPERGKKTTNPPQKKKRNVTKPFASFAVPRVPGLLHFPPRMTGFHLWRGTPRIFRGFLVQRDGINGVFFGAYQAGPNAGRRRKQRFVAEQAMP